MSREIKVRNISDDTFLQLKGLSKQLGYDSFNQFLLSQLELIASNNGLTLYNNDFAKELVTIKSNQKQLLENQHQIQINQVALLAKQNILRLVVRKSPTGESTHYFFFVIK